MLIFFSTYVPIDIRSNTRNSVLENMFARSFFSFFFFFDVVICRLFAKRLVLFGRVSIADGVIRAS